MIDTSRIVPYLEREQSENPCTHTASGLDAFSSLSLSSYRDVRALSVIIMIIDRQTLVQIVLLFDIDHNDGRCTCVSREEHVNLSRCATFFSPSVYRSTTTTTNKIDDVQAS